MNQLLGLLVRLEGIAVDEPAKAKQASFSSVQEAMMALKAY